MKHSTFTAGSFEAPELGHKISASLPLTLVVEQTQVRESAGEENSAKKQMRSSVPEAILNQAATEAGTQDGNIDFK